MNGRLLLALGALGSLVALTGVRQFMLEPLATPAVNAVWFVLQILPLLLVVPGMLRLKPLSILLASLAAMLYFVHGVLVAATAPLRTFGLFECVAAVVLVAAAAVLYRDVSRA